MSMHQVALPSPPPDTQRQGPMSGLFSKTIQDNLDSNDLSGPVDQDTDTITRKRVEFHPWATNILEAQLSTPDSEIAPSLKSLPPSRDCQLSSRPILKPALSLEYLVGFDGQNEKKSTLENMDSLLHNLDQNDRSSSVDAYQTITSLIKIYDEPPEHDILQRKMTQLQKYIQRDLVVLDKVPDTLPSEERLGMGNLVMSALKVLVTMVWSSSYSPCLTDDFRIWALERSIDVLRDHTAPKATLLHYMHLLATQTFRAQIITGRDRPARILHVLQELTDHVSGKAVVAERLLVYQKLIDQAKQTMKSNAALWVKNLLSAMAHSFKEVRSNAISAGTNACTAFSGTYSIAHAARLALAEVNGERSLSASITNRLERILAAKDEANQIPQIWTIVLMLCNSGNNELESWPQLHEWLKLIQKCFNCSDTTVRAQAFMAWNRLYYVASPQTASDKVVSMLAKPAIVQLDRTGNVPSSKGTRHAVISSYCMLLYYAFRPSANSAVYTRMWNDFVVKLMTSAFLSKSSANCDLCCRVLSSLFHSSLSASRVWNESRAHGNAPLDPLELPAIDPKWIRLRIASILSTMKLLVRYSSFGPSSTVSEQAYIAQAWKSLMKAIRESSSKEVTATPENQAALQNIVNFLTSEIDDKHSLDGSWDNRLLLLTKITIGELGPSMVLHTIESSSEWYTSVVLQEVFTDLVRDSDGADRQLSLARHNALERCFSLVSKDLFRIAELSESSDLTQISDQFAALDQLLSLVPTSHAPQFLIKLQQPIVLVIDALSDQQAISSIYKRFCSTAVNLLSAVSASNYKQLDDLLSTLLSLADGHVHESVISLRDKKFWLEERNNLGPKVSKAISYLLNLSIEAGTEADNEPAIVLRSESAFATKLRQQASVTKARHDDSQIQFTSIGSSPVDFEFESQLLTARQKEVRHRQKTEPALTFADIRSSPIEKKRRMQSPEELAENGIPTDLPSTPTIPQQRGQDEEEQPPTPTPRVRRSLQITLQPDIPSSPPSVVGGDSSDRRNHVITSSPVKDLTEVQDVIELDPVDDEIGQSQMSEVSAKVSPFTADHSSHDQHLKNNDLHSARDASLELALPEHLDHSMQPTVEHYETTEPEALSPVVYSDEYDALAASQLSQDLVEQSRAAAANLEIKGKSLRMATKRKRTGDMRTEKGNKKKRKSSELDKRTEYDNLPTIEDELEDCIIVDMSHFLSRPLSGAKNQPQSPIEIQTSQGSSGSTPTSQQSSTKKRSKRSRRKYRVEADIDSSPASHVSKVGSKKNVGPSKTETDVDDSQVECLSQLPSLTSEVQETIQSQHQEHEPSNLANESCSLGASHDNTGPEQYMHAPAVTANIPELPESSSLDHSMGSPLDLVGNLQSILDSLHDPSQTSNIENFDIATIHSLCFKIGLKAQEIGQKLS